MQPFMILFKARPSAKVLEALAKSPEYAASFALPKAAPGKNGGLVWYSASFAKADALIVDSVPFNVNASMWIAGSAKATKANPALDGAVVMDDRVFPDEFCQILSHVQSYAMHMYEIGLEESKKDEDDLDFPDFFGELVESEEGRLERHVEDVVKKSILVAKLTGKIDAFHERAELDCQRLLRGEPACTAESGDDCWIHERVWDLSKAREDLRARLDCKRCHGSGEVNILTKVAGTARRSWTRCPQCSITR